MQPLITTPCVIKYKGTQEYRSAYQSMQEYTNTRNNSDADQIWLLEHNPVYTTGGRESHLCTQESLHSIPLIKNNRGGLITYHGPGQWIVYLLLNLRAQNLTIRSLVDTTEQLLLELLKRNGIRGTANPKARGVYIDNRKIASIGYRVSRGFSYHGFSLNVDMDLAPFQLIEPCGIKGQEMTQVSNENPSYDKNKLKHDTLELLIEKFCSNHQNIEIQNEPETTQ